MQIYEHKLCRKHNKIHIILETKEICTNMFRASCAGRGGVGGVWVRDQIKVACAFVIRIFPKRGVNDARSCNQSVWVSSSETELSKYLT